MKGIVFTDVDSFASVSDSLMVRAIVAPGNNRGPNVEA
jgi:hypothetical protein